MFVPHFTDAGVVCVGVCYLMDVVEGILTTLKIYHGARDVVCTPDVSNPRTYAEAVVDADGVPNFTDPLNVVIRVHYTNEAGESQCCLVWIPTGDSSTPPPAAVADVDVVYLVINTMRCRMRKTQQEHFHANHPTKKFVIVFSDEVAMRPRVPVRAKHSANRHVRIAASDAAVRCLPLGSKCIEAVLNPHCTSTRTVA
jgi:hypothetical protein